MNSSQANRGNSPYLFIGGRSYVYALDKLSGDIAWEIALKPGFFKSGKDFVTLSEGLDFLFAFTHGIAFCLDKYTGRIIWQTPIKRLKYETTSMAVDATLLGGGFEAGSSDATESDDGDSDGGDGDGGD
ncbi:MAG: hypothetical protein AAF085_09180 [Planctomycetota bacterium]